MIKLELTVENINLILKGLSELPFKEVSTLITEIVKQANKKPNDESDNG